VDEFSKFRVLTDSNDQTLDGSDNRREREDSSSFVLFSGPVAVLEEGVEDSAETE
jgi:hypothetical protein